MRQDEKNIRRGKSSKWNKQTFLLSEKEVAVINNLLNVAQGSDWFNVEVLPPGIKNVAEANRVVNRLCKIFN